MNKLEDQQHSQTQTLLPSARKQQREGKLWEGFYSSCGGGVNHALQLGGGVNHAYPKNFWQAGLGTKRSEMFSSSAKPGQSSAGAGEEGSSNLEEAVKLAVLKEVKPPWDPLSSPDWDNEQHTKDALLRIKR